MDLNSHMWKPFLLTVFSKSRTSPSCQPRGHWSWYAPPTSQCFEMAQSISRYYATLFFFSNAALLKTVAVMSLQTLGQKEADNYSPWSTKQNKTSHNQSKQNNTQTRGAAAASVTWNVSQNTTWDSLPIHYSKAPIRSDVHFPKIP